LPTSDTPNEIMKTNSRSSSAEGLRMIRTNLEFMLGKARRRSQTIFITSTFPKEGKTFISATWLPLLPYQVKKCC
jgi:Mrp family chromosome partitioning ATPase